MTSDLISLYQSNGLKLIPVPAGRKNPVIKGWQIPADRTIEEGVNVGVLVGAPSAVADIDVDAASAVDLTRYLLENGYLKEFQFAAFGRPAKEVGHLMVRQEHCKPFKVVDPETKGVLVEVRGDGQQTIIPPSVHPNGEMLTWLEDHPVDELWRDPEKLPVAERIAGIIAVPLLVEPYWEPGSRNDFTLALVGYLLKAGWTTNQVCGVISAICRLTDDPELPSRLRTVMSSAERLAEGKAVIGYKGLMDLVSPTVLGLIQRIVGLSQPPAMGPDVTQVEAWRAYAALPHNTDLGNSIRLHESLKDKIKFVPYFNKWLVWRGTHWQEETDYEVVQLAKSMVLGLYETIADIQNDDARKEFARWVVTSESQGKLDAMVTLLKSQDGVLLDYRKLDQHPMLLPVRNGMVNLKTGQLEPASPDHLMTKFVDVDYDPDAQCPLWEAFLLRIMGGNKEMVEYLQRLIGHALTGDAGGKYFVFLWGPKGDNGKSTMVETILRLLGDYGMKSPTNMITEKRYSDGVPNDIARLRGVRFTVTNEISEGMTFADSVIKDLTGNDTLSARYMRGEWFDFRPSHKLWIYGNHKPVITGTDNGIWNRVKLVEFDVVIPKEEQDPNFQDKLAEELPGILVWAVRGELDRQAHGLQVPTSVDKATLVYRGESDVVRVWVEEQCEVDPSYKELQKVLYTDYLAWCKESGTKAVSRTFFGDHLDRLGYEMRTGHGNQNYRRGLKLVDIMPAGANEATF